MSQLLGERSSIGELLGILPITVHIDVLHCHFEMPKLQSDQALVCGMLYNAEHPMSNGMMYREELYGCDDILELKENALVAIYTLASELRWYTVSKERLEVVKATALARM